MKQKRALVIGTEVAISEFESGASLRLNTIVRLLEESEFVVTVASRVNAKQQLGKNWTVIVLVSFVTARFARAARKKTKFLWLDSTDSWTLTRFSQIRSGSFLQFLPFIRDTFYVWTAPKLDLISFITSRDARAERQWWKSRSKPFVFPVTGLERNVHISDSPRLVFMGDGSYGPNKHAFRFLEKIVKYFPTDFPIHVYGKGFPESKPGFVFHGYVKIDTIYHSRDIYLAPIFSGAGLKLKVAVPAFNSLLVITTPEGASGFISKTDTIIVTKANEFAEKCIKSLQITPDLVRSKSKPSIFECDESSLIRELLLKLPKESSNIRN